MRTKSEVIALVCIILFWGCVSNSPAIEGPQLPIAFFQLENVEVIDTVNVEIEAKSGETPDVISALLLEALGKNGNGIINIVQSVTNGDDTVQDRKEIWSGSAMAIRISDNNYLELYNVIPKSNERIYGVGSAKFASQGTSIIFATTRARADIARAYSSTITIFGESSFSSVSKKVTIKDSIVEQIVLTPDGTIWTMLSAKKEDLEIEE
jgi:hypothetical protein